MAYTPQQAMISWKYRRRNGRYFSKMQTDEYVWGEEAAETKAKTADETHQFSVKGVGNKKGWHFRFLPYRECRLFCFKLLVISKKICYNPQWMR